MYTGASEEAVREAEDRRSIVFGVRRAIETLANVPKRPQQFLEYADAHQLWTPDEEHVIRAARQWLDDLDEKWSTFREQFTEQRATQKFTVVDGAAANGEASTEPSGKPIELGRTDDHFEPTRWSK
jgi:hypothetical protein